MDTFDIREAETQLAQLIDKAAKGEPFIIAKAGKPLVQVTAIEDAPTRAVQRIGFMEGEFTVPDDFDTMFQEEIEAMFYGEPKSSSNG
jgi:prevent-host-death family protein